MTVSESRNGEAYQQGREPNSGEADGAAHDATEAGAPAEPAPPPEPVPTAAYEIDAPLLGAAADWQERWLAVQAGFVDEPREAVESAEQLVSEVVAELEQVLARERDQRESRWREGGDRSTEDLRVAFQRYRAVFDRLTST
jgi:hypothetical protein